mgnify:FL=1|jgi:hypothetical protein
MFGVSPFGQYSLSGYTDQPVILEGIQATISLGSIATISANADVSVTGNNLTTSIGSATQIAAANITAITNLATVSLGTITPKAAANIVVTTNLMGTVSIGTVTIIAKAVVIPTTNVLTSSVNGPGVITWNDIATGASQTWTNVET